MAIKIGSHRMFSHYPNGPMWEGSGAREVVDIIPFVENRSPAFQEIPEVVVSIKAIDSSHDHNTRVEIDVGEIYVSGFKCIVKTWGDTKLALVDITWVAIGIRIQP